MRAGFYRKINCGSKGIWDLDLWRARCREHLSRLGLPQPSVEVISTVPSIFDRFTHKPKRSKHPFGTESTADRCNSAGPLNEATHSWKSNFNRRTSQLQKADYPPHFFKTPPSGTSRSSLVSKCMTAHISRRHHGTSESYRIAILAERGRLWVWT